MIKRLFQYNEDRDSEAHKGKPVLTAQMPTCLARRCCWGSAGLGTVQPSRVSHWKATGQRGQPPELPSCSQFLQHSRNSHLISVSLLMNTLDSSQIFSVIYSLASSSLFFLAGKLLTPSPHSEKGSLSFVLCIPMSSSNA